MLLASEDIKQKQNERTNGSVPFPPVSLQRQVVLFADVAGVHVFITGESLHCFLVGWCTNKSYVIATLWLFIHASNLLSLIPHTTPLQLYKLWSMLFLFWSGFCMAESWARRLSLWHPNWPVMRVSGGN